MANFKNSIEPKMSEPHQGQDKEILETLAAERRRRLEQPILNDDGSSDYVGREGETPYDPELEKPF